MFTSKIGHVYFFNSVELKAARYQGTKYKVPGEIKRREVELDLQVGPEEIMSREVELGCEGWTSFALNCFSAAVQRMLSL